MAQDRSRDAPRPGNRVVVALTSKAGWGALLLFACATVVFSEVSGLRLGTAAAMGPGYFPAILGGLFVVFGVFQLVEAGRNPGERVELGALRPLAVLLGGIVLFAVLLKPIGGAAALAVLVVVTALAERGRSLRELVLLAIVVVGLIWLIFVVALDLQVNMAPAWWRP